MPDDREDEQRALKLQAALAKSQGAVQRALDRVLVAQGLTHPQFEVLGLLAERGASPLVDVGRHLGTTQGNVTCIVDNLEKQGLVTRTRDTRDKRILLASLTLAGSARLAEVRPAFATTVLGQVEGLTPDEQEILTRLLRKLATSLEPRA